MFSVIPGAVEMYYGCMKLGLSIMCLFFGSIFVTTFLECGPLAFFICITWFYGFFHARNMASLSDQELQAITDEYIIDIEKVLTNQNNGELSKSLLQKSFVQIILIFIGLTLIWGGCRYLLVNLSFYHFTSSLVYIFDIAPRLILGGFIVWYGIYLMVTNKKELNKTKDIDLCVSNELVSTSVETMKDDSVSEKNIIEE